jgi:hypothetical protein
LSRRRSACWSVERRWRWSGGGAASCRTNWSLRWSVGPVGDRVQDFEPDLRTRIASVIYGNRRGLPRFNGILGNR